MIMKNHKKNDHEEKFSAIHVEKAFFNIILHEMLDLFQKVISSLESISSKEISPECANQLEKIIQMIDKHTDAVKKIGILPFDEKKVDIFESLEKLALKYGIHPSKNVDISIQSDKKMHIEIHPIFTKALETILNNAIEYTDDKNVEITIILKQEVDYLKVIIVDKGIGIPTRYRKCVFEKYFKVPGYGKGSGLGLYLAKKIVEIFNGTITIADRVEGQPSQGTKFIIEFPYYFSSS